MNLLTKNFLALTIVLTTFSCSKNDEAVPTPITNTAGVYVAGNEFNGAVQVAKLWKNGVATNLSNGTKDAYAVSVFVTNNDVYVAGYEANENNKWVAKLWINGVATNLTDGTKNALANALYVFWKRCVCSRRRG